jgi:hypothetical protein
MITVPLLSSQKVPEGRSLQVRMNPLNASTTGKRRLRSVVQPLRVGPRPTMPSPQLVDEAAQLSGAMHTDSSPGLKHEGHQKSPSILTGMICKSLRRVRVGLSIENIQLCCLSSSINTANPLFSVVAHYPCSFLKHLSPKCLTL